MQYCCDAFRKANQRGTDNELYGAAIWMIDDNRFLIGCGDYPHISFCPWCGTHFDTEANHQDQRPGQPLANDNQPT